jgi:hypothetical protein
VYFDFDRSLHKAVAHAAEPRTTHHRLDSMKVGAQAFCLNCCDDERQGACEARVLANCFKVIAIKLLA